MLYSLLNLLLFLRQVNSQAVDPNAADFSTVDGYDDLRRCVQNRLENIGFDVDCPWNHGYSSTACLCRPSTLGSAVQVIQEKTMEDCQNIDDKNLAKNILLNFCASKGYTSVVTPVVASATGGYSYTVTATVTQISTLAASAGSSSTSDANQLPSPRAGIYFGTVIVAVLILTPLYGRWLTTRSLR